ncbi:MAG: AsmA family protein, partial [Flavobacteriaceae bacterium]
MRTLLAILLICVFSTIILSLPIVQTRFAKYATKELNKEFGTNIDIDRLRISLISWDTSLRDVYVEDYQKDTLIYIKELTTSILSMRNLVNGRLEFGDVELEGLNFKLITYKDAGQTNLDVFVAKLDDGKPRAPDKPPFYLTTADVYIENSQFRIIDENVQKQETLNFKDLNIEASDFLILGPEVSTRIEALSFNSRIGVAMEKLSTSFKYTKQQMRFDSLEIKTPESNLFGNVVFDYRREDLKDFMDKVNLSASFSESEVSLDEINLIYDEFGKGRNVYFSGNMHGVLNDLEVSDLFLNTDNTGIRGDFHFRNL